MTRPQILLPYYEREAATLIEAARYLKTSPRTARKRAATEDIGRRIGDRWLFSKVAMLFVMECNADAHRRYIGGDRTSLDIVLAFRRFGIDLCDSQPEG